MTASEITFEYPLNEKMRSWLRIEYLLEQLVENQHADSSQASLQFIRTLTELLDIFERNELRADLLKELEKQQQKLQHWLAVPGIDTTLVTNLIDKLANHSQQLSQVVKFGVSFKEDKFLSQLRQRLSIPGGYCNFDIPTLHLWLHLPVEKRRLQLDQWYSDVMPLHLALQAIMHLIRQSAEFTSVQAQLGFYQDTADEKDLIRIRLESIAEIYPQISGHKTRFAIRFLPFDSEKNVPDVLTFQLACC